MLKGLPVSARCQGQSDSDRPGPCSERRRRRSAEVGRLVRYLSGGRLTPLAPGSQPQPSALALTQPELQVASDFRKIRGPLFTDQSVGG